MKNELIKSLNGLLSDYQIYYQNLRGFHWNIQGRDFFELHLKFEELYNDATIKIDEVAERILTIGGMPLHSFEDYLQNSKIEVAKNVHNGEKAVITIVDNLSSIVEVEKNIKNLAEELNDSGTADMVSAFIELQEKTLWMYKAWLK
ncbi:MAG: DNA starvation/stationary phase protection protein [Cyclobacteriaceae bacterium]|nr:DNA starvation/stationary phase protection protein [Cyclobacteriaceae bacterium]